MFCGKCGTALGETHQFCRQCGARRPAEFPATASPPAPSASSADAARPPVTDRLEEVVEDGINPAPEALVIGAVNQSTDRPSDRPDDQPIPPGFEARSEPKPVNRSWWARRRTAAKIALIGTPVVVLAAAGFLGLAIGLDLFRPSDAELVRTLSTTTETDKRQHAAADLAARHSLQSTQDLALAAKTNNVAADGLEALREALVGFVFGEMDAEQMKANEAALQTTIACLGVVDDQESADALAKLAFSPDYGLMSVRINAMQVLGQMSADYSLAHLIAALTLPSSTDPSGGLANVASAALLGLPDTAATLVQARVDNSTNDAACIAIDRLIVQTGDAAIEPLLAHLGTGQWVSNLVLELGTPALSALSEQLKSDDSAVRYKALDGMLALYERDITAVGPYLVLPDLVPLLLETRSRESLGLGGINTLERVLARIGQPAVDPLIDLLGEKEWVDNVLVQIGAPAVTALTPRLSSADSATRYDALGVLLRMHQTKKAAVADVLATEEMLPLLIEARSDAGYGDTRDYEIYLVFQDIGDPAAQALVPMLPDTMWAGDALSAMGPAAEPALMTALTSGEVDERLEAAYVLVSMYYSGRDNVPQLAAALESKDLKFIASHWVFYIQLGQAGTESTIADALLKHGKKQMGLDCLNCGNETLDAAARKWGTNHGYYVYTEEGAGYAGPAWGG